MRSVVWFASLLICAAYAAPTTPGMPETTVTMSDRVTDTTTGHPSTDTVTATAASDEMLKHDANVTAVNPVHKLLAGKQSTNHIFGRVVLANTQLEGSSIWGVNQLQADLACDRIASQQKSSTTTNLLRSFFRTVIKFNTKPVAMEGHLLSVGSSYEVSFSAVSIRVYFVFFHFFVVRKRSKSALLI